MRKQFKKKFKQILATSMTLSMLFCNNAFATPIDLVNSTESVVTDTLDKVNGTDYFTDEDTNEWSGGTINEEVRVTIDLASQFTITIPKEIILDGETGKADYKVKAVGDIAGDQVLKVVPDVDFILSEAGGKADVTATVTQPDTKYTYIELQGEGTEYDGNITATLTAGEWAGKFNFNINFEANGCEHNYVQDIIKEATQTENAIIRYTCSICNDYYEESVEPSFSTMSWSSISEISGAGEATNYFSLGDEKSIDINGVTYNVEIVGFNHDYKASGGKAGITLGLKEIMTNSSRMYSSASNSCGWTNSSLRSYLNNTIYSQLTTDLKNVIKSVTKYTNAGNQTTTIRSTTDKLFLFSYCEVGFSTSLEAYTNEGTAYSYFNKNTRWKRTLDGIYTEWWLRSPRSTNSTGFNAVSNIGSVNDFDANDYRGIVFGFCI